MDPALSSDVEAKSCDSGDEEYYLASDNVQTNCCRDSRVPSQLKDSENAATDPHGCASSQQSPNAGNTCQSNDSGDGVSVSSSSTFVKVDKVAEHLAEVSINDMPATDQQDGGITEGQAQPELTDEEKEARRLSALKLKDEGNDHFRLQLYDEAVQTYTEAIKLCPLSYTFERAVMHANRAACYAHLERLDDAITDCTEALALNSQYTKTYLRRADLYEKKQKYEEAMEDYKNALQMPDCTPAAAVQARQALDRLPALITKRNEELKAEMFGKLKDLGNMVLRPFGLSTDNFKMVQDPRTGSYSINFQQGAAAQQPNRSGGGSDDGTGQ